MRTQLLAFSFAVLAMALPAATHADSFTGLGFLPVCPSSQALGVSADGSTVVGACNYDVAGSQAFRWTASAGMVGLGYLPGTSSSSASAVSADGSVVVGTSSTGPGPNSTYEPFRWTSAGGTVGLSGTSGGSANGLSADGSVVVGGYFSISSQQAFRWTAAGGAVGLTMPQTTSLAYGASADGSAVVGTVGEAFLWTSASGIVGLGVLPNNTYSLATAISSNGLVVVGGRLSTSGDFTAFRWTSGGGMVSLGSIPGSIGSMALGVSADGSVVVGYANSAIVWGAAHGFRSIQQVLTDDGLNLTGWNLTEATGISADGNTIVGYGTDPSGKIEAWIATIPEPGTGDTDGDGIPEHPSRPREGWGMGYQQVYL